MHFTLWPSLTQREGGHAEIDWQSFVDFVRNPVIADDKSKLEGWSPARFKDNRRAKANAELVSCIVLDDDKSGLPLERILALWGDVGGVVHTSHSSTPDAPKWRIVLRCSRDMTPDEHARVWAAVRDVAKAAGQTIDEATKDPSRLWFVPAHKPGAVDYAWAELGGEPLDVDAILATMAEYRPADTNIAPAIPPMIGGVLDTATAIRNGIAIGDTVNGRLVTALAPVNRRQAMAVALGAAWPAKGRHEAQLALAGALRAEGFTAEEAVEFLCTVCRAAGNEDRPKREATVRHTWSKPEGSALTGWNRLKAFVDPVVVDSVRAAIGRDAEFNEKAERRLAALVSANDDTPEKSANDDTDEDPDGAGLGFEYGCWTSEPPPIPFLVNELIPKSCVGMFFGRADALKTWLLFSLGLAVSTGKPWLGRYNVPKSARVGIVDFETGKANVDRRLYMLGAGDVQNLGRKSFAKLKPNDPEFWIALGREKFDLVIIDSLRRANPGANENESGEAIVPLELAAEFSEITKAAVFFIHHAKKDSADGWPEFRGSGAIEDQVDVSFAVKKTDVSPELKTVEVRCEKPGDMIKPAPFVVEVVFDDKARKAMLKYVEPKAPAAQPEKTIEDENREKVFTILRSHSAGVPKPDLLNVLKGKTQARRDFLSSMMLAGDVVEYKADKGRVYVMLNPKNGH